MLIGYARVSTQDQNADLQVDALERAGCERIYTDHASGAKASRPQLDRMLEALRKGDTVVVWKLDRLGRSTLNLAALLERFREQEIGFRSLTEQMDTTTPGGVLVFNVFAAVAQLERDMIRERTKAGVMAARARGRKGGRPRKLTKKDEIMIRELYESRSVTIKEIAAKFNVGRTTIYKAINRNQTGHAGKS
ncbi:recombinase family protein [Bifidobacterium sp. W8108]|uniref:recombinase family protein n=1 Tax=unclassified Bifidobacterium TaxID=2608897 RepID=UPI0018DBC0B1|nr:MULTISPECIES: recombinase family protein [unclassified Bifidobacterium]MBH9979467.1 recombinase family protein [Bifidobacterium sp. W8108]MBI0174169.1 recombinase family protein [Bifidobacterium sp. M0307]